MMNEFQFSLAYEEKAAMEAGEWKRLGDVALFQKNEEPLSVPHPRWKRPRQENWSRSEPVDSSRYERIVPKWKRQPKGVPELGPQNSFRHFCGVTGAPPAWFAMSVDAKAMKVAVDAVARGSVRDN